MKSRLGANPLDALLGEEAPPPPPRRRDAVSSPQEERTPRAQRIVTITAAVPRELADEIRAAVVFLERQRIVEGTRPEGGRDYWTVAGILAEGIDKELTRLRKKYNNGEPFPQTTETPRPGARLRGR